MGFSEIEIRELSKIFRDPLTVSQLYSRAGFDDSLFPIYPLNSRSLWIAIDQIIPSGGHKTLLTWALHHYPANPVFQASVLNHN
jgi:hypothetical protein